MGISVVNDFQIFDVDTGWGHYEGRIRCGGEGD